VCGKGNILIGVLEKKMPILLAVGRAISASVMAVVESDQQLVILTV
jgi:hypothetical protein